MSKSFRKAILYAFFGIFLILGTGTVFYAQGYRFDLGTFRVKKVGAIYIQSHPRDTAIFLDGKKSQESRGILSSGVLLQSLFPKTYKVELKLDGYEDWQRTVSVEPSLVVELSPILLPKERTMVTSGDPQNIYALSNGLTAFKIGEYIYAGGALIPGINVVDYSAQENELITLDAKGTYYFTRVMTGANTITQKLLATKTAYMLDFGENQLVSYSVGQISLLQIGSAPVKIFTAPQKQTITQISPIRSNIAWSVFDPIYATSSIWIYGRSLNNTPNAVASIPGKTIKLAISAKNILGALQDNGDLYFYDLGKNILGKKGSGVREFTFSPSGLWTAVLAQKTLEIYSQSEDYTRLNLNAFPEISSISWYRDESHLILGLKDGLGLLDFSAIEPENIQKLVDSANTAYDPDSNVLYYSKDGKVWSMAIPK